MEMARAARSGCCFWLLVVGALGLQADRPGYQSLSFLSSYEITVPKRIPRERREASTLSLAQVKLSYIIEIEGNKYLVHLEKNKELLPKDFTVYTYGEDGKLRSQTLNGQGHCHYQGYVEGVLDSMAAVSTCSGLRGLLQVRNITYGIEPMDLAAGAQHLVYRMENVKKELLSCGVVDSDPKWENTDYQHAPSITQLLRRKRGVLLQTRYVELFIVVDKERYDMFGRNGTAVREEMVQLANYLDSMYIMLNIRIVLVGLEIWTKENKIRLEGGAGDVLANFVQWREKELISRRRHDSAQLILKKAFGGTAGMAYVGTVCSKSHAGGINVFGQMSLQMFASIVAHELGHNLGMNHDDERDCSCETESCIMSSGASGARNFSSCSAEDFEKLTLNRGGSCLLNIPTPVETYSVPYCGNKLVDADEECDCGSPEECESDPCCEARTCKLRSGADCAYGDCCHNCHYLSKGTMCRESAGECDLPEYCNGTTAFCPQDVTMQNGHPCHQDKAYCYNGMCQYYDAQCRAIFGPKAKAAPEICFSEVNSKGDRFGNCGYHGYEYKKCSSWNSMCGKLQCENVKTLPVFGIKPAIIQTPIKGNTCWGVDFQLGSDVPDPGMVNEGTKCAPGKVCKHFQCVDVAVLDYDCDTGSKCNGQGVCNSNKNCHCDSGWAPPHCDNKGYGGSVDSGPPYNDLALHVVFSSDKNTTLPQKVLRYRRWSQQQNRDPYEPKDQDNTTRNWLLAFFCLILPMLLLLLFAYIKRNQIVSALLPLIQSFRDCCRGSDNTVQEPVHTDYPPSIPYSPTDTSRQVNWQSGQYPVPSYSVNPQPYSEPYHYSSPIPPPQPTDQQFVPTRPPPPALKTKTKMATQMTTQEHFFPSRPAPLPPK